MGNKKSARKSISPYIIPLLVLVVLLAIIVLNWKNLSDIFQQTDGGKDQPEWEEKISNLEKEIAEKLQTTEPTEPMTGDTAEVSSPNSFSETTEPPSELQQLQDAILAFFNHLDQQDYIIDYKLQEGSRIHFSRTLKKVFANPPIVTREADDLFSILKNMSHFYRILGRQEINLIKDVLTHEVDNMEQIMAELYRLSEISQSNGNNNLDLAMPLASLYEYGGFFVNTLGGQAYLFRRDSRLRLLVRYYAILIIDQANSSDMNRHGIDIRVAIEALIDEMEATRMLAGHNEYLTRLTALQTKYKSRYE
jgi:hypothetical protein